MNRRASRQRRRRTTASIAAVGIACIAALLAPAFAAASSVDTEREVTQQVEEDDATLRVVGSIPTPPSYRAGSGDDWQNQPSTMLVDPVNNVGFMLGYRPDEDRALVMYDLETLEVQDMALSPAISEGTDFTKVTSWAVDPVGRQLFTFEASVGGIFDRCPNGRTSTDFTYYYERVGDRWQFRREGSVPAGSGRHIQHLPCGAEHGISTDAGAIYVDPETGRRKLYITGVYVPDDARKNAVWGIVRIDPSNSAGSSLLIRQIDLDTLVGTENIEADPAAALDWQIDLHKYGCGRRINFFVGRTGDSVFTYCHEASGENRHSPLGKQGYVVRIPLDGDDMPRPSACIPHESAPCALLNSAPFSETASSVDGIPTLPHEVLNAQVRRIPTLPGFVQPFLDPESGRVLLLTDDAVNGSAVWVLDPFAERFIGIMTPGDAPPRARQPRPEDPPPPGPTGAGFNPELGRAYLYGLDGIVVAAARQAPPMAGTLHPVLSRVTHPLQRRPSPPGSLVDARRDDDLTHRPLIAVAPSLNRLFVPVSGEGYVVLEDQTADPLPPPRTDLDQLTTQVDEVEGVTEAHTSSEAEAQGFRVLMAGGTSNLVNPVNPVCSTPVSVRDPNAEAVPGAPDYEAAILVEDNSERSIFDGSCLAERVVSRGNRDFSLGYTTARGGTSTGVEAEGQGVAFAPGDDASDHDMRSAGECYRSSLHASSTDASDHISGGDEDARAPFDALFAPPTGEDNPGSPYHRACREPQERVREHDGGRTPDLNAGTQGRDGDGFPAPRARCSGATTDSDTRQSAGVDSVRTGVFRSEARCDASLILAKASSSSVGITFPGAAEPVITIEQTSSSVDTRRTADDGVVTAANARADGVRIGPLHIGSIWSKATAKAHGRTGTAHGELQRAWCDVSVGGDQIFEGCKDVDSDEVRDLIDAFNQGIQKLRLSIPEAEAQGTPGGYQGVVIKDPAVAAADQTVNEDDSLTVPALQATFYNDNAEGRSRTIHQFAGVRSESSYGIVLLPQFDTPDFGPVAGFTTGPAPTFSSLPINRPVYGQEAQPPRFAEQLIAGQRPAPPESTFRQAVDNPIAAALQALEWLRQHPREAALLFLVFSILGLPVYLAVRRRAFERSLAE